MSRIANQIKRDIKYAMHNFIRPEDIESLGFKERFNIKRLFFYPTHIYKNAFLTLSFQEKSDDTHTTVKLNFKKYDSTIKKLMVEDKVVLEKSRNITLEEITYLVDRYKREYELFKLGV